MKCSKCGFDNPESALFCEKCDWKIGDTYIPPVKVNPSVYCILAMVLGIIAIVPAALATLPWISIVVGAIGLVVGGYSFNLPRLLNLPSKNMFMALSAIGLALSAIGFIWGLALAFA